MYYVGNATAFNMFDDLDYQEYGSKSPSESLLPTYQSTRRHARNNCNLQEHPKSQCCEWQKGNVCERNWTVEMKEEMWRKQQEFNLREEGR